MTTSAKQTSLFGTDESTSSQVDFLANHTAWQGSDKAQRMLDISGQKCAEQFESAGRPGLWARTFLGLLIGQEGWFSSRCALTWKVKGTKYNRLYCQLQVSTLRTGEIGSGLWDIETDLMGTPRAMERPRSEKFLQKDQGVKRVPTPSEYIGLLKTTTKMDGEVTSGKKNPVSGDSGTLAQEIMSGYEPTMQKLGLMATPNQIDWKGETGLPNQKDLNRDVRKLMPTPAAQDSKNATLPISQRDRDTVPGAILRTGQTGQLSPLFVLEMMGFSPDWTELPFLNGETNQ